MLLSWHELQRESSAASSSDAEEQNIPDRQRESRSKKRNQSVSIVTDDRRRRERDKAACEGKRHENNATRWQRDRCHVADLIHVQRRPKV